jgi:hypothetical protein
MNSIMKKSFIFIVFTLVSILTLNAQDYTTSAGLRAGIPLFPFNFNSPLTYGATIRHFINKTNAVEGIVASSYDGVIATGLFESEHWTGFYPGINWYWGVGAHAGYWAAGVNRYNGSSKVSSGGAGIGIDGILGVEYTFDDFPINVSVDALPTVNLVGYQGWNLVNASVSIRYIF